MKSPKFKVHVNRELCDPSGKPKKYYSERDYRADMKRAGVEHFDPSSVKKFTPPAYARSAWAIEMHKDIKDRNGRAPGDRFIKELEKRGYTQKRADEARRLAQ